MMKKLIFAFSLSILGLGIMGAQAVLAYSPLSQGDYGFTREWTNTDTTIGNMNCPWFGVSLRAPDLSYTMAAYQSNFHIVIYNADNTSQIFVDSWGGAPAVGTYRFPAFDPTRANSWDVFLCGVPGATINGRYLVRVTAGGSVNSTVKNIQNYPMNVGERSIQLNSASPHHFMDLMLSDFGTNVMLTGGGGNPTPTYSTPNIDRSFWALTWNYLYYPGGTSNGLGNIDGIADTGFQRLSGPFSPGVVYLGVNKPVGNNTVSFQPGNPNYNYDTRGQQLYGSAWPYPYSGTYYYRMAMYDKTPTGDPYHGSINTGLPIDGSVNLGVGMAATSLTCINYTTGTCAVTRANDTIGFFGTVQNTSPMVGDSGIRANPSYTSIMFYDSSGTPVDGTWISTPEIIPGQTLRVPASGAAAFVLSNPGTYYVSICPNVRGGVDNITTSAPCIPSNYVLTVAPAVPAAPGNLRTNPSPVPCGSTSTTLQWDRSAYATTYRVYVNSGSGFNLFTTVSDPTSSVLYSPITPGNSYSWYVIASNVSGDSPQSGTASFTDPICKSFTLSAPTPPNIIPGAPTSTPANISVATFTGGWASGDSVTITLQKVVSGASCGSAAAVGFSYLPGSGSLTYTTPPPGFSIYSFNIKASSGVATGSYTLCFSVSTTGANMSPANPTTGTMSLNVNYTSWLQVGSAGGVAGDVYSGATTNPSISIPAPESNLNTYFFANGVAGVVRTYSNASLAMPGAPNQSYWKAKDPTAIDITHIQSDFVTLLASAKKSGTFVEKSGAASGTITNTTTGCNNGAAPPKVSQIYNSSPTQYDFTNPNGKIMCNVLFVGSPSQKNSLVINNNLDPSFGSVSSPQILIVNGDVIINPAVTTIDATIIFTGTLSDGGGNQQLTVNGSLLHISSDGSGGFALTRSLDDNSMPAEKIVYQPDQLYKLLGWIGQSAYLWVEK